MRPDARLRRHRRSAGDAEWLVALAHEVVACWLAPTPEGCGHHASTSKARKRCGTRTGLAIAVDEKTAARPHGCGRSATAVTNATTEGRDSDGDLRLLGRRDGRRLRHRCLHHGDGSPPTRGAEGSGHTAEARTPPVTLDAVDVDGHRVTLRFTNSALPGPEGGYEIVYGDTEECIERSREAFPRLFGDAEQLEMSFEVKSRRLRRPISWSVSTASHHGLGRCDGHHRARRVEGECLEWIGPASDGLAVAVEHATSLLSAERTADGPQGKWPPSVVCYGGASASRARWASGISCVARCPWFARHRYGGRDRILGARRRAQQPWERLDGPGPLQLRQRARRDHLRSRRAGGSASVMPYKRSSEVFMGRTRDMLDSLRAAVGERHVAAVLWPRPVR